MRCCVVSGSTCSTVHPHLHAITHTDIHSHTYPQARTQNMHEYTHICLYKYVHTNMYPNTHKCKLKNIPKERQSWRPGGGEGELRGGVCWWGWWWLKLDPDRGSLASVAPLHKHMLSFGEVFLQTDWLDSSFFFRLPPCDRALGSDYCQAPQQLPLAYFTMVQYIPQNTVQYT